LLAANKSLFVRVPSICMALAALRLKFQQTDEVSRRLHRRRAVNHISGRRGCSRGSNFLLQVVAIANLGEGEVGMQLPVFVLMTSLPLNCTWLRPNGWLRWTDHFQYGRPWSVEFSWPSVAIHSVKISALLQIENCLFCSMSQMPLNPFSRTHAPVLSRYFPTGNTIEFNGRRTVERRHCFYHVTSQSL
jgi:hypothetical protein